MTVMDVSPKICTEAEEVLGQKMLCQSFEELNMENMFEGTWTNVSFLHVSREKILDLHSLSLRKS